VVIQWVPHWKKQKGKLGSTVPTGSLFENIVRGLENFYKFIDEIREFSKSFTKTKHNEQA